MEKGERIMEEVLNIKEFFKFTEWVGLHYLRMKDVWCHKFNNQMDKENWKTTEELYKLWEEK